MDELRSLPAQIKPHRIGAVPEPLGATRIWREAGWAQMVSHRLGETTERFIAGYGRTGIRQIKSDATARGERSTKIGRFVEIETTDELPRGREK